MLTKLEILNRVHPKQAVYTQAEIRDQADTQARYGVQWWVEDVLYTPIRNQVTLLICRQIAGVLYAY